MLLCIPEGLARLLVELTERTGRQLSSCASELTCSVHSQQCTRVACFVADALVCLSPMRCMLRGHGLHWLWSLLPCYTPASSGFAQPSLLKDTRYIPCPALNGNCTGPPVKFRWPKTEVELLPFWLRHLSSLCCCV